MISHKRVIKTRRKLSNNLNKKLVVEKQRNGKLGNSVRRHFGVKDEQVIHLYD